MYDFSKEGLMDINKVADKVTDEINGMDLEQLAPVIGVIAKKFQEYRAAHNGLVPRSLFLLWLKIAGVYVCADVVVTIMGRRGVLLKRRGGADAEIADAEINDAMRSKFQIPGAILVGNGAEELLARSLREIFGENQRLVNKYLPFLKFVFLEMHPESWRECTCLTLVSELLLDPDDRQYLVGDWEVFSDFSDPRIVAHQRETLQYLASEGFQLGQLVDLPGSPD